MGMTLLAAMAQVESGGDDDALNVSERARGRYQLRPIYVRDVNRILELRGAEMRYKLGDAHVQHLAEEMMLIYWEWYGMRSDEQKARSHNGGPRGPEKDSTLEYWNKVKALMEGESNDTE